MIMTPEQFAAALRKGSDYLDEMRKRFHHKAAVIVKEEREKGFDASTSPTGERWKQLDPETIKRKKGEHTTQKMYRKKKGGPSGLSARKTKASSTPEKPLIDTGAMRSPTVSATKDEGRVTMAKSRSEVLSSAGSIAKIHQEGLGHNKKREHWGFYPNAIRRIQSEYDELIKKVVRKISNG
jgi:hypothetical protein